MSQHHGVPVRGLVNTPRTTLHTGRFGRLFPGLRPAKFGGTDAENERNLLALGAAMATPADPADPKNGKDDEESGIPALYTYFGQFVDHDLTFDPTSSLQHQNDPDALVDFRTPAFDLDNLYGRGPDDEPFMYEADGKTLVLGVPLAGADPDAHDLPRAPSNGRAIIGDPRNDENSIVSQLQGVMQRFHNRVVRDKPGLSFHQAQDEVRRNYQHVVLHDFLPRIVSETVLAELRGPGGRYDRDKLKFFGRHGTAYMPVEFAVAAYRLGHSMVRPGYQLNDHVLQPIFPPAPGQPNPHGFAGLTGFRPMIKEWGIDWGRFIDVDTRAYDGDAATLSKRLQFAYRLDTALVNPLAMLPTSVTGTETQPPSLGSRNLVRAWRMGLPTGQDVARHMGVPVMPDAEIKIGVGILPLTTLPSIDTIAGGAFKNNCPLWTYILAEAMHHQVDVKLPVTTNVIVRTPQLGPVGGRIVAEVFIGLAFFDQTSVLHAPEWQPMTQPDFKLKDLVAYATGMAGAGHVAPRLVRPG